MKKFLYAFVVILLLVVGLIGLFYGLFILWQPLAYIIGGLLLIGLSGVLNQAYDNTSMSRKGVTVNAIT
ncbi:membrane protein [Staphylococcus phage S-CoN_Ph23]|nr:membrane protein [Staphylococcus phage S-CoN_Ph19]WNM54881.1 membrane protein [Staphylococcus phage S-CoN_Ph23]WNM55000.1 membrane protein [Staphylococcus phage S-CoN_Ph24]